MYQLVCYFASAAHIQLLSFAKRISQLSNVDVRYMHGQELLAESNPH
jgi:hypothetical protein